jgi:hypothetical protein
MSLAIYSRKRPRRKADTQNALRAITLATDLAAAPLGIDPIREHLTSALLVVPLGPLVSALIFFWGGRGAAAKAA